MSGQTEQRGMSYCTSLLARFRLQTWPRSGGGNVLTPEMAVKNGCLITVKSGDGYDNRTRDNGSSRKEKFGNAWAKRTVTWAKHTAQYRQRETLHRLLCGLLYCNTER